MLRVLPRTLAKPGKTKTRIHTRARTVLNLPPILLPHLPQGPALVPRHNRGNLRGSPPHPGDVRSARPLPYRPARDRRRQQRRSGRRMPLPYGGIPSVRENTRACDKYYPTPAAPPFGHASGGSGRGIRSWLRLLFARLAGAVASLDLAGAGQAGDLFQALGALRIGQFRPPFVTPCFPKTSHGTRGGQGGDFDFRSKVIHPRAGNFGIRGVECRLEGDSEVFRGSGSGGVERNTPGERQDRALDAALSGSAGIFGDARAASRR